MPSSKITYMTFDVIKFCEALINDLAIIKSQGVNICLIHVRDLQLEHSDIDILASDIDALKKILPSIGYSQIYSKSGPWVRLENNSGNWLVLDISYKYSFLKGQVLINEIIKRSIPSSINKDLMVLSEIDYGYYLAFKGALLKGHYSNRYIEDISKGASMYEKIRPSERNTYQKSLNLDESNFLDLTEISKQIKDKSKQILTIQSIKKAIRHKNFNYNQSFLSNKLKRLRNLLIPTKMIAIIGPDGSGKSTVVNKLSELPLSHIQYMGPGQNQIDVHRSIKPIKSWLDKGRYRHSKNSVIGKIFRISYLTAVYIDILWRYLEARWEESKGKIVFFDRYAFDVYIRNPDAARKFLFCRLFPRPNLVILLEGDPQAINKRKNELTISEITKTYSRYKTLFQKDGIKFKSVSSSGCDLAETMSCLCKILSSDKVTN